MIGLCILSMIPVRSQPSHKSEMVNQLLFGDIYDILKTNDNWQQVRSTFDGYEGWIDSEQSHIISKEEAAFLTKQKVYYSSGPVDTILCMDTHVDFQLSIGSILYGNSIFEVGGRRFKFEGALHEPQQLPQANDFILSALKCVNSPYLWGGKTIMGFDCSGFVQTIFRMNGKQLPRDASQQILCGNSINFSEVIEGDLAFFGKDGKTTHVGIINSNMSIIHCSGKVRIDELTEEGILHCEKKTITHNLTEIRRII
jgi:gamma-D-glutamyl-L-lysine dipeptidyl-peptidase